jgi:hypothetical protein
MAVLSKFLTEHSSQVNFKNYATVFKMFLDVIIQESEAIIKFLESEGDQIAERELLISESEDKIWFYKEVKRIIEDKPVNVEDVLKKEIERKAKFKPHGTKLDWTNKGVQDIFVEFLFKTLLFHQEIYGNCSLGNLITGNRELYTFLTKGVDQFDNMIFQGSSEEGLTIYNKL